MAELLGRWRIPLTVTALLVLGACGQTGPLVLPGSIPASSQPATPDEAENDNEDEVEEGARQ